MSGDGWIAWAGGECGPLAPGVMHERKYRDGNVGVYSQRTGEMQDVWRHMDDENDIIAYRVVQQ